MKIKPIKITPMPLKLTPISGKPLELRKDTDKDGVPDYWDCQPLNPDKQGRFHDFLARGSEVPNLNKVSIAQKPVDWLNDEEDNPQYHITMEGKQQTSSSMKDALKKTGGKIKGKFEDAGEYITKAIGQPPAPIEGQNVYLFIKNRDNKWREYEYHYGRLYTWDNYIKNKSKVEEKMAADPQIKSWVWTSDSHFLTNLLLSLKAQKKRQESMKKMGGNLKQQFDIRVNAPDYAAGPSRPLIQKNVLGNVQVKKAAKPKSEYDAAHDPPIFDLSDDSLPAGYQEESRFGRFVVPYKPIGRGIFVTSPKQPPAFSPPFLKPYREDVSQ